MFPALSKVQRCPPVPAEKPLTTTLAVTAPFQLLLTRKRVRLPEASLEAQARTLLPELLMEPPDEMTL